MAKGAVWAIWLATTLPHAPVAVNATPSELAGIVRSLILESLPSPLYDNHEHWGKQKEVTRGLKWTGQGLRVHAEEQRSLKNDGLWWRAWVRAPDIEKSLRIEVRDLEQTAPGNLRFTISVAFDVDLEYERQRWDAGRKLIGTSARGRAHVSLTMRCEAASRVEARGRFIPDVIFRVRVIRSDFGYDQLVFEHVAGLGGEAAKLLGDAAVSALRQAKPSLEKRLIEKANAAVLKAGDIREVRIGLSRWLDKK